MFIAMSALTARRADRYATVRLAAVWTLVMGCGIAVAALNASTAATLAFLAIAGASSGVLIAPYLPARGDRCPAGSPSRSRSSEPSSTWSGRARASIGPTAGGAVSQAFGDQVAFWLLAAIAVASATWMWLHRGRGDRSNRARASRSRS